MPSETSTESLLRTVERLEVIQDRFDAQHSDPTGTSVGDDGENADGRNRPDV
jgi:hypothetical protein